MRYLLVIVLFLVAACQSNVLGTSAPGAPNTPIAMSLGDPLVSNSLGAAPEGVVPVQGINHVSLHADRSLRLESTCTQILKLSYSSNINYAEVITGLKNRALLMGGNAVAIVGWAENSSASGMVGKIYMCKNKPAHVHPH